MDSGALSTVVLAVAAQVYVSPIHEVSTAKVVVTYLSAGATAFVYLLASTFHLSYAVARFTALNLLFLSVAISVTLIRRLYFSPLSHLPGPRLAALSNLYKANEFRTGRGSRSLLAFHREYNSDVVRIGPSEVSIKNVEAVEKIYKGKYPRGTFYEVGAMNGEFNLNTQRNYEFHTPWRRIWEKAFVSSAFKDYNPRVENHVSKLVHVIQNTEGKEVECSKLMDNLIFDIMADLSFAHDAGMQDGTGDGSYMDFIHKYMSAVGVVAALRNLSQLLIYLPESSEVKVFRLRGEVLLSKRQTLGSSRKDIFSHLLAEDTESDCKFTQAQLNSNANLVIVAGADTTSSTLTRTFHTLAKQPEILLKMRKEIVGVFGFEEELTVEGTRNLPFLNAVVNEALRLLNPVPMGAHAATPPSGVTVAGTFIPGNVQVSVPHIALMTDPRYFAKPEEFIPERWTEEWADGVIDKRAFIPFGYGVHSCVGRQLALNELRIVLAAVVRDFDVVLGDKHDEREWERGWKDHAVLQIGKLWVRLVPTA